MEQSIKMTQQKQIQDMYIRLVEEGITDQLEINKKIYDALGCKRANIRRAIWNYKNPDGKSAKNSEDTG